MVVARRCSALSSSLMKAGGSCCMSSSMHGVTNSIACGRRCERDVVTTNALNWTPPSLSVTSTSVSMCSGPHPTIPRTRTRWPVALSMPISRFCGTDSHGHRLSIATYRGSSSAWGWEAGQVPQRRRACSSHGMAALNVGWAQASMPRCFVERRCMQMRGRVSLGIVARSILRLDILGVL